MGKDIVIKVENVSKKYCKSLKRSMMYGVRDIAKNTLGLSAGSGKLRKDEFWAVNNVSFEVKKGETLGIIGPNGSGKTTMLKLLNGIFWPDKGKISVKGRVGALIAVGAGFHPMLTGRENVYVNGAILGMNRKEIDEKFDEIVKFADIGNFLDTPVKFYSDGMFVRLGFAVAAHCEPDILLVDEVLAVGDIDFQNKCLDKIASIRDKATVLIVSHNMNTIQLMCDRCLLLQKGKQAMLGKTTKILDFYLKHAFNVKANKFESKNLDIEIFGEKNSKTNSLTINKEGRFKFTLKKLALKKGLLVTFSFINLTKGYSHRVKIDKYLDVVGKINEFSFSVNFGSFSLPPGTYTIRVSISDGNFLRRIFHLERTIMFSVVETDNEKFLTHSVEKRGLHA